MPMDETFTGKPFTVKPANAVPVYRALLWRVSPRSLISVKSLPCRALNAFIAETNTSGSNRSPSWLPMVTIVGASPAKASIIVRSIAPAGEVMLLRKFPASKMSPLTTMRTAEFGLLLMMLRTACSREAL